MLKEDVIEAMSAAHDTTRGSFPPSRKRREREAPPDPGGRRKVFLAQGFDGASMGEIAKVAGVSKGTLYVYFDSKESCSRP